MPESLFCFVFLTRITQIKNFFFFFFVFDTSEKLRRKNKKQKLNSKRNKWKIR